MKIENPKVTLADDARLGVKEEIRSGFLDWLHQFSVTADDGELYSLGGSILSMHLEQMDVVSINIAKGKGQSRQLPNSIYRITDYPGMLYENMWRHPAGTLTIEKREHSICVSCGSEYRVECFDNNEWHFMLDTQDGRYKADLWHRPQYAPLWYGREKPSYLTQHSITYGYNWVGEVHGQITVDGKTMGVKGLGIRERYVAVDSCAAEIGAWEDWGWISFNEIHSSFYDMKLGMKDFALYDLATDKYYPEGNLQIQHENWVFFRELGGFIPTLYKLKIELQDAVWEAEAEVCNATTWGATHKVPENPVATLTFGEVNGCMIASDGSVRSLTGGRGVLSIRQWHPYPYILPPDLYGEIERKQEECLNKFDTL